MTYNKKRYNILTEHFNNNTTKKALINFYVKGATGI